MASTELFGSPLGDRAFLEDQHTKGLSRLQNAQADRSELAVQQERQFANLMRMAATGGETAMPTGNDLENVFGNFDAPEGGMANKLNRLAQLATQSGLVTRGATLAKDAATLNSRYSAAAASRAVAGLRQIRQRKEEAGMLGQVMGDVTDQDSFDRANAAYQMTTNKVSPYAGLPYTPQLVQRVRDAAISAKDQEAQALREADSRSRNAFREARLRQHDEANAISAAARGVQRDQEGRLVKVGGGKPLTISNNDRDAASALIVKDFPEFGTKEMNTERFVAANTVASAAKVLMQKNPALNWQEALAQAYTTERASFKTETGMFGGRKVKFEGGGKSAQTAIPLPKSAEDARVGTFYYGPNGAIGRWNGKTMDPVGGKATPPPAAAADETDDGEEE